MRCGSCAKRLFRQYACLVRARSTFHLANLRASRMENGQPRTPIAVPGRNALDGECPNTNPPLMHPTHPSSLMDEYNVQPVLQLERNDFFFDQRTDYLCLMPINNVVPDLVTFAMILMEPNG